MNTAPYTMPDDGLPPAPPEDMPKRLRMRFYTQKGKLRVKGVPMRAAHHRLHLKRGAIKKPRPKKVTHAQLAWLAEYLNHKLGFKPPIDSAVNLRELQKNLLEVLPMISKHDKMNDRAWSRLRQIGWNETMSVSVEEYFAELLKQGCSRIGTIRRKMRERFKSRMRIVNYRLPMYLDLLHHLQFIRISSEGEMVKLCVRPSYS